MKSPQNDKLNEHLSIISTRFDQQKAELRMLRSENKKLKIQLEEIRLGQSDIFSHLADAERIKLKQQVNGLIAVIDNHLEK
jgi:hypothetical protein